MKKLMIAVILSVAFVAGAYELTQSAGGDFVDGSGQICFRRNNNRTKKRLGGLLKYYYRDVT